MASANGHIYVVEIVVWLWNDLNYLGIIMDYMGLYHITFKRATSQTELDVYTQIQSVSYVTMCRPIFFVRWL